MARGFKGYNRFAKYVEYASTVAGFWPPHLTRIEFYHKLLLLNGFVCCLSLFCIFYFCATNIVQLYVITGLCRIIFSHTTHIIKTICFYLYRRKFMEMHGILELLYKEATENDEKRDSFYVFFGTCSLLAYLQLSACAFTIIAFVSLPGVLALLQFLRNGAQGLHFTLPYRMRVSFEVPENVQANVCQYLFQFFTFNAITIGSMASSGLLAFYSFHLTSQLRLLRIRFRSVQEESELRECVERFVQLRRCKEILEVSYGPISIFLFITVAITLCTLVFEAFTTKLSTKGLIIFAAYTYGKLDESFAMAWFGALVTRESEKAVSAIYDSPWYDSSDRKFKSSVLIAVGQRPFVLNIFGFYKVSVDSFTAVLNSTISFFFLLRSLDATR